MRLGQAVETCRTSGATTQKEITVVYQALDKKALFQGLNRVYKPAEDGGRTFPPENVRVQHQALDLLLGAFSRWSKQWDLVITQERGNQTAKADIIVEGTPIYKDVPILALINLKKQLKDVAAFVEKLPVRDQAETWQEQEGLSYGQPTDTQKTEKTEVPVVLLAPTEKHPGQAQMTVRDKVVGYWTNIKISGEMTAKQKAHFIHRVEALRIGVDQAIKEANTTVIESVKGFGEAITKFLSE